MNRFTNYLLLLLSSVVLFASCSTEETTKFSLLQSSIYFSEGGNTITVGFVQENMKSAEVKAVPYGWSADIDFKNRQIIITSPRALDNDDIELDGSIMITAEPSNKDNAEITKYLTVGVVDVVDISSQASNSVVINKGGVIYSFPACKGESGEAVSAAGANILWQDVNRPLGYATLEDDQIRFYVNKDEDDLDKDGFKSDIIDGNAVVAAYDSHGNVLWSWHIWVTDLDLEQDVVTLGGTTFMNRNLGALDNANDTDEEVLDSYGLYYQWGRKDPFVGPYYYNAAGSLDDYMRDATGAYISLSYAESDPSVGTDWYATSYPLTFITGVKESDYDWLYLAHESDRWSDNKTVNDPCPKGWRVPAADAFDGFKVPTLDASEYADLANKYGWELSDGNSSALFMGLGRRDQLTGSIQNVNTNDQRPAPWVGNYWSVGTQSNLSEAMYFFIDTRLEQGGIESNATYNRANGMQIRCQRDE